MNDHFDHAVIEAVSRIHRDTETTRRGIRADAARSREPETENIHIGNGSRGCLADHLEYRILGDGEESVRLQVAPHESNGCIHGQDTRRVPNKAGYSVRRRTQSFRLPTA